ncbi:cupin domain-containing protein [Aquincola sp. MAHUQ-54]|uniref:Cupin domain-containing protein n=1 Tax=Aquincola agrisoli TaxID=3119538 RepID=A0AAW9Q8G4_9BURK
MAPAILKLGAVMPGVPDVDHPKPERLIRGNPRRETWNVAELPVRGQFYTGVWRCEPGQWRIAFGPAEVELFTVLQGRCRLHADDGTVQEAGPGEALFIPAGFTGAFEVLETLTKTYAIVDGDAAQS